VLTPQGDLYPVSTTCSKKELYMGLIILILLIILLLGGLPTWGYSRNWGYGPSGVLGTLLLILLILMVFDVVHWNTYPW
jgi:hypothetical protein